MQYELTTSKSSSAIVPSRQNGALHLIDCFRRFAGKSKPKNRRLFNFGFKQNDDLIDPPLSIDQKQKSRRFGSTPNVHACKNTEFLSFSPSIEPIDSNSNCMNQSCYGAFPVPVHQQIRARRVDDYDNMNGLSINNNQVDGVKRSIANKRSRKAVSEVGCPINVIEVGNSRKLQHLNEQYAKNDNVSWRVSSRNSCVDSPNHLLRNQRRSQYFENTRHSTVAHSDNRRRVSNCKFKALQIRKETF
jgi:hypothetical protein